MEFRDKIIPHCFREVKCHADCSWLNLEAQGKHLTNQLLWVAAWLLVKRVCPVHLVDELVFVLYAPLWCILFLFGLHVALIKRFPSLGTRKNFFAPTLSHIKSLFPGSTSEATRWNLRLNWRYSPDVIGLMVVLLTFVWDGEYGFSTMEVGAFLGNGCRIQGQNHVALLQRSEATTGFHRRSWI